MDWKSKIPDLSEIASMGSRFGHDVADSVHRIVADYKKKHFCPASEETISEKTVKTTIVKEEKTTEPCASKAETKKDQKH